MRKATKFWLITATVLFLVGTMIFGGVMMAVGWNFKNLSTVKYETNSHTVSEPFHGISVETDTANVTFLPSEDGTCRVVCYEEEKIKHVVEVENGTLKIHAENKKGWYEYIGINFDSSKVTVYLPQDSDAWLEVKTSTGKVEIPAGFKLQSVDISVSTGHVTVGASTLGVTKIKATTGDVKVENTSVGELDLKTSTGKINVTDVTCEGNLTTKVSTGKTTLTGVICEDLTSHGSTGSITLTDVIASGRISIERSTGNVIFDRTDAAELVVDTDTGDVKGSLLTDKIFFAKSETGRVIVPESMVGGRCEIESDTGDIKITVGE